MEEITAKPMRQKPKLYCSLIDTDSQYDCIIIANNEKHLNEQLTEYSKAHEHYTIVSIIKGYPIEFVETKKISFLK